MNLLDEQVIECPWCGESLVILVDTSVDRQSYVEDCQVCCQPMVVDVAVSPPDGATVSVTAENR